MKAVLISAVEAMRIGWARFRFNFWLDVYGVRRRRRRELQRELGANLADAARDVGIGRALAGLGGTRRLALESIRDSRGPAWSAGLSAGLTAGALVVVAFFALSLYYAEGVIDARVGEPVESSLFPFFGSSVEVHDQRDVGLSVYMKPGFAPLVIAMTAFVAVARPWRALNGDRRAGRPFEPAKQAG